MHKMPSRSTVQSWRETMGAYLPRRPKGPTSEFEELWLKVEACMSDLDRSISLHLMMEQRQLMQNSITVQEKSIHTSQLEGLQLQKSIEEKVDASHKLLEAAISRIKGNRHPKSKAHRKNQRGRAGGRIRKDKAGPGHETKDPTAENGQTSNVSESTGEVGLDEWESSHDEAGEVVRSVWADDD
ncbi:hypothetical protein VE03_02353 [Pseudogymnoascus sp. 23342-1-I1]|nr:hypothetical protein VE03_02353 [Pseudogymnoascus sp. 23342-1-I1]